MTTTSTLVNKKTGKKVSESTHIMDVNGFDKSTMTDYKDDGSSSTWLGDYHTPSKPEIPKDAKLTGGAVSYTVQSEKGADDYLWNIAERELENAGMKTDGASIQAAVDAIADKSGLENANVVADNTKLDLSTIYTLQAKGVTK